MGGAFAKFDLTGRTAVVTGGSGGLGYFMARGLVRSGATVVLAAWREEELQEAAHQMAGEAPEGTVDYAVVDLYDRSSIDGFCESIREKYRGVDILVGNAGADLFEPVDSITDERMDQILQINLAANVALTRAFLPHMRRQKWGRLIYSSSSAGTVSSAQEGMSLYSASKAAIEAFARATALETGHDNITANTLVLGLFGTDMWMRNVKGIESEFGTEAAQAFELSFASMTAVGRLGEPHEIEGAVQLLASDAGSFITGSAFAVHGGMGTLLRPNEPRPDRALYR